MAKTLHYDFATDKSLVAKVGPTLGITRTTLATYIDSGGLIAEASSGEARFTHSIAGDSLGLLVEEARTNLLTYSTTMLVADGWILSAAAGTSDADAAISPDGTMNAIRHKDDNGGGSSTCNLRGPEFTMSGTTTYCQSVFAKADGLNWFRLRLNDVDASGTEQAVDTYFDLANGAIGTSGADVVERGIEDYGNGWYRCWHTCTTVGGGSGVDADHVLADADLDDTVDRDGTSSVFLYGPMVEAGANPTSYIPTAGSTVTRNLDSVTTTNVSWHNENAGSIYSKAIETYDNNRFNCVTSIDAGGGNDVVRQYSDASQDAELLVRSASSEVVRISIATQYASGAEVQAISAYALNDFEHYANGTRAGTGDQLGTLPTTATTFRVGRSSSANELMNGTIAEVAYFDERLDNDTLADYSLNGLPDVGTRNYLAIMRRQSDQMRPKMKYPKTRKRLRDL